MAAGMASSACPSGVVDIVCGTLQAKLFTKDLSSSSSRCIPYGSLLLSPCDFQRQAGKASARNWKNTIRYLDQPLARVLESFTAPPVSAVLVPSNSQPPGSSTMNTESADIFEPSPSHEESTSVYSQAPVLPSAPLELPVCQPVASPHFHWGPVDATAFSLSLDSAFHWIQPTRRLFTGGRTVLMYHMVQLVSSLWPS